MRPRVEDRRDAIIDVVVELLETEGHDAVQVRTVARRAAVSLSTIYQLFGTRDELVIEALERWMATNLYPALDLPGPGESLYDTLVGVVHAVFAAWEQSPAMFEAYCRARAGPGGGRLGTTGLAAVWPLMDAAFEGVDPDEAFDIWLIFFHVGDSLNGRFARGELEIDEMVPILERTLRRLVGDGRVSRPRPRP